MLSVDAIHVDIRIPDLIVSPLVFRESRDKGRNGVWGCCNNLQCQVVNQSSSSMIEIKMILISYDSDKQEVDNEFDEETLRYLGPGEKQSMSFYIDSVFDLASSAVLVIKSRYHIEYE